MINTYIKTSRVYFDTYTHKDRHHDYGLTRCLAITQALIAFLGSLGILIPICIFFWHVERDNKCFAPTDADFGFTDYFILRDVSFRWRVLLIMFWVVYIVDAFRYLCLLAGLLTRSKALISVFPLFFCNDCFSLVAMVLLHVWRFNYMG